MNSGMWFGIVKPDQPLQKKVKHGVTITQAVLDTENAKETDSITRVVMTMDEKNLVVANLSLKHGLLQTSLNLPFAEGDTMKLAVSGGSSAVHLFGCTNVDEDAMLEATALKYQQLMADAAADDSDEEDEEEEDEEEELEEESTEAQITSSKRKRKHHPLLDKSFPSDDESDNSYIPTEEDLKNDSRYQELSLLHGEEELDDDDDDEEAEEEEDSDEEGAEDEEMEAEEVEAGDSDDDEEEEEDSEEDEEEEEEVAAPQPSKKKMKMMNGHAEHVAQSEQKKSKKDVLKEVKAKTPQKAAKQPTDSGTPSQKDQPKGAKAQKKDKLNNKENQEVKGTPKQDKKKQKGEKSPAAKPNEGSAKKGQKKMLSGGVVAEDITPGNGPVVKPGNMVSVYYEGRLKSNNAVFDKNVSGPPFKFRVGRGEVIKGWDVGVAGMRVGGKRKLVVPPSMGYGKQGAPPAIPSNAALCFDVTVLAAH